MDSPPTVRDTKFSFLCIDKHFRSAPTYKNLCCWVVHIEGLQNGGTIVCDHNLLSTPHALQNLVLRCK